MHGGADGGWAGLRSLLPRGTQGHGSSTFPNERGQAWEAIGKSDAIIHIGKEIHPKLFGGGNQRLKGVPCLDSIRATSLQTHIAFANPLASAQFGGIVVQKDFGMDQHHEQLIALFEGACFALIQLVVATRLCEELIKLGSQSESLGWVWMLSIGKQLVVEQPERLAPLF